MIRVVPKMRAYPRSRGGTGTLRARKNGYWGLSPLARGNPIKPHQSFKQWGPIPARAGEPEAHRLTKDDLGAYPRSRGGTAPRVLSQVFL